MKIKGHIGRTVGAVAIVGGTAAVLFTGSPAHTQFSATSNQIATINGGTVAETITNGSFNCTGLIPPNNSPENGGSGTYPGHACIETIALKNTGSVNESFDLTVTSITGPASTAAALAQLQFTVPTGNGTSVTTSGSTISASPSPEHLATVAPGVTLSVPVTIGLAADTSTNQNDWNGQFVNIGYTVTATPSDSQP